MWTISLSLLGLGLLALPAVADTKARATSVLQTPGSPPTVESFDATDCVT